MNKELTIALMTAILYNKDPSLTSVENCLSKAIEIWENLQIE